MMVDYHHDMIGTSLLTTNYFNGDNPIYGKSEVDFEWKIVGDKSPIEYSDGLGMSDFMQGANEGSTLYFQKYGQVVLQRTLFVRIQKFRNQQKFVKYNCTREYSTGPSSCLRGYFILNRQVGYFILWAFLPLDMVARFSDEWGTP